MRSQTSSVLKTVSISVCFQRVDGRMGSRERRRACFPHVWGFQLVPIHPIFQILILEILQCIHVVKIFAFLDFEQNCLFKVEIN